MEIILSLIGFAVYIAISCFVANYAKRKGKSFGGYFLFSFLISPLIAFIFAAVVPVREDTRTPEEREIAAEKRRYILGKAGGILFRIGLVLSFLTGFNVFATAPTPEINTQWLGIGIIVFGCLLPIIGSKLYSSRR